MSQCTNRYLSLCSKPVLVSRDGLTGENAKLNLPFYGFWFASGATYTFPNTTVAQWTKRTIAAPHHADTFQKTCCG